MNGEKRKLRLGGHSKQRIYMHMAAILVNSRPLSVTHLLCLMAAFPPPASQARLGALGLHEQAVQDSRLVTESLAQARHWMH